MSFPCSEPRDDAWMEAALECAREGEGLTRPNPPVGAVLVKNGRLIGRGSHLRAGGPHAEVVALAEAGASARGATLYVTLEPCSTFGRTGPCTDAIASARVKRVVVAAKDPNPAHQGRGLRVLRRRGIDVTFGPRAGEAAALLAPFAHWVRTGTPLLTLKLAMTLDGRVADRKGDSKWITGPAARWQVHDLRRRADAIMVGAGTARRDDPGLLPRPARGRKPFRVVVVGAGALDPNLGVFTDRAASRTLVACPRPQANVVRARLRRSAAEIVPCRGTRNGRVSLPDLMKRLAERGLLHVVCEGGGKLAGALVAANLADEFVLFYGPGFLGDRETRGGIADASWTMEKKPRLTIRHVEQVGPDVKVLAVPKGKEK